MKKFLNIFPASALLAAAVSCVGLDSVDYSAINGSIFPVTDEDADAKRHIRRSGPKTMSAFTHRHMTESTFSAIWRPT